MQSWTWLWPFLSMMHEACPASGGNSSVGTTSSAPTLKSRSSANGAASTTSLRLCHCGGLRLVVWWAHSAVSAGTAMAMTRALSVAAPDIAWVNCLNIYFISGSLVIPLAAGADVHVRDMVGGQAARDVVS